jgi:hypothetical protein
MASPSLIWEFRQIGRPFFPVNQNQQFVTDTPFSLGNVSAFLKTVVRDGVLQDKSGPSVAIEFGALLPGFLDEEGYGAHLGGIVSQRWDWGTINWNLQGEYTRDHHPDVFASAIIEGPDKWKVRPVSEFFYEEEFGVARKLSALVESRPRKSGQDDRWSFCLTAGTLCPSNQEIR